MANVRLNVDGASGALDFTRATLKPGTGVTITTALVGTHLVATVAASGGGGGTTDHAALTSNLAWTSSAHTGTASTLAGFDGGGAAAEVAIPTGGIASHAMIMSRVSLGF
jgi:hypothetical protein